MLQDVGYATEPFWPLMAEVTFYSSHRELRWIPLNIQAMSAKIITKTLLIAR